MKTDQVTMTFNEGFKGELNSPTSKILVGDQSNGIQPYHMLYGALGSCFYATFLSIATKMRLTFDRSELIINGTKRETPPTTLDHVTIEVTIFNPSDEVKIKKAIELGAKHCSIVETISQVAQIELITIFKS